MKKKTNKSNVIIIIILIVILLMLGYYNFIYMQKIKELKDDNVENSLDDNSKDEEGQEEVLEEELEVDDSYVKYLFSLTHAQYYLSYDKNIFDYDKKTQEEMSMDEKTSLAANIYADKVEVNPDNTVYISKEEVKRAYELVFGKNTYPNLQEISYKCGSLTYNELTNNYEGYSGCEGSSLLQIHEKIIRAYLKDDYLEITSAYLFTNADDGKYYRSADLQDVIDTYDKDNNSSISIINYINANYKKLGQYTYKFKKEGLFYYYQGFSKVN